MRQSPSRNQRSGGWKLKHFLQLSIVIAACLWLLYEVKHTYDKKKMLEEDSNLSIPDRLEESKPDFLKLGRKDIKQNTVQIEIDEGKEETEEAGAHESKEEGNGGDEGRGAGDDDAVDEGDRESAEGDGGDGDELVDEEEKGGGKLEEQSSSDDQDHEGDDEKSQKAQEENYKADDASSAVAKDASEVVEQEHGNLGTRDLGEEEKRPEREELEGGDRTNVTGDASIGDEVVDDVPNTAPNSTSPVLPNSTALLEIGGDNAEHGSTKSDSDEHMEQQNNSTSVEPGGDRAEDRSNSIETAADEQVQTQDAGAGDNIAETGDSPHENGNVTLDSNEQNTVDVARNVTGDSSSSLENILSKQTDTPKIDGEEGESDENSITTTSSNESGDAVEEEASNSEEEQESLIDLSTLPHIEIEKQSVEDIAEE